jgi:hypothetical protein
MSKKVKYRPVLTAEQIQHMLYLAKTEQPISSASLSIIATLVPWEAKIANGVANAAYTTATKTSLMDQLGGAAPLVESLVEPVTSLGSEASAGKEGARSCSDPLDPTLDPTLASTPKPAKPAKPAKPMLDPAPTAAPKLSATDYAAKELYWEACYAKRTSYGPASCTLLELEAAQEHAYLNDLMSDTELADFEAATFNSL